MFNQRSTGQGSPHPTLSMIPCCLSDLLGRGHVQSPSKASCPMEPMPEAQFLLSSTTKSCIAFCFSGSSFRTAQICLSRTSRAHLYGHSDNCRLQSPSDLLAGLCRKPLQKSFSSKIYCQPRSNCFGPRQLSLLGVADGFARRYGPVGLCHHGNGIAGCRCCRCGPPFLPRVWPQGQGRFPSHWYVQELESRQWKVPHGTGGALQEIGLSARAGPANRTRLPAVSMSAFVVVSRRF
jgi:hypothetical protein